MDTYDYVELLTRRIDVETVLDAGCGQKGVIAQHLWENVRPIKRGYACDRFTLKELPSLWNRVIEDAEKLPSRVPRVDVITHCGLLEHLEYEKAFRVLHVLEQLAKKLIFFSCSTTLRQVDYKVNRDGNPYHYYRSWWDAKTFEALGYHVDRKRMAAHHTFNREAVGWVFDPGTLTASWAEREAKARQIVAERRCGVEGCDAEPFVWTVEEGDRCYCCVHYVEKYGKAAQDVQWWLDQPIEEVARQLSVPPWRVERLVPRLAPKE